MPIELIIREGNGPERRQIVEKPTAVVGRREDSDVVLPFSFVSARHGRFFFRGGVLRVEDMGSTNGTIVNGIALEPMVPRPLAPDDLVEIDRLALRARWVEEAPPPDALPTYHETAAATALAPLPPAAAPGAPAGVWEIVAGPPAAARAPIVASPPVRAARAVEPVPFSPSRTLGRVPAAAGSGRFRLWSVGLQVVGLLAVLGGLTLLLFVLLS